MTRTPARPGKLCRIVRRASVPAAIFASVIWSAMQPAQADTLLDEVVTLNGEIFYFEHKVPVLVIGVVRNGETSVRGFGERAGKGSKAPDGDTVMRLGSITKVFTGEMLAHLTAKNTVQLAQPLTRSWPELAARTKADVSQIRLVDLATHSGGLPREVSHPPPKSENDPYAPITVQAFADWVGKEPLLFRPGSSVHYSNFGFDLLAHGLSKAANQPYPASPTVHHCPP